MITAPPVHTLHRPITPPTAPRPHHHIRRLCVRCVQKRGGSASLGGTDKSAKGFMEAVEKGEIDPNANVHPADSDVYKKRPHQVDKQAATDRANSMHADEPVNSSGSAHTSGDK